MRDTNVAEVPAPAKINLCLLVGPKRSDGLHPVCSLMEKIRLFDTLRTTLAAAGSGARLFGPDIPAPENVVIKAVRALEAETGHGLDVDIELKKEIPVAAGLAGGSSDAAAILKLLDFHFGLGVPQDRLAAIAFTLGADTPFFLGPGPQLARGAGELLEPVTGMPDYALVLIKPPINLATAAVYESFDRLNDGSSETRAVFEDRCAALSDRLSGEKDLQTLVELMENDLEAAAAPLFPQLDEIKQAITDTGALKAQMSGSGSCVFGIFPDLEAARQAAASLDRVSPRVLSTWPLRL